MKAKQNMFGFRASALQAVPSHPSVPKSTDENPHGSPKDVTFQSREHCPLQRVLPTRGVTCAPYVLVCTPLTTGDALEGHRGE